MAISNLCMRKYLANGK